MNANKKAHRVKGKASVLVVMVLPLLLPACAWQSAQVSSRSWTETAERQDQDRPPGWTTGDVNLAHW
jgi:hypothetical protein